MNREQAFELRDSLLDQLGAMSQDTSHAWSALPSLGVYHGGAEEGWEGGYGLSVLIPEGQEREHFEAWTKHAISEADGEVNVATVGPFGLTPALPLRILHPAVRSAASDAWRGRWAASCSGRTGR